jgi:hypothetical protein
MRIPGLCHDRFLPNPFLLIIHESSYCWTVYGLGSDRAVKLTTETNEKKQIAMKWMENKKNVEQRRIVRKR